MKKDFVELKDILLSFPGMARQQGEEECFRILQKKLSELTEKRKSFDKDRDNKEKQLFQELLLSIAHESDYCKYSYDKPMGYAGDFRNLEMIWYAITEGDFYRYLGETNLGKIISSISFRMENPLATVKRTKYIGELVKNSGSKIASIGCGSCIEMWDLNKDIIKNKDILLLDQENLALVRAREKLKNGETNNIQFVKENILKFIIRNKEKNLLGQRDFIYLVGLLDYFSVKSSKKIIKTLWKNISPQGKLFFTNAHPDNPTRLWMEYAGEWYLNYKDEQDMYAIVDGLENVYNIDFKKDQFDVYQYIEIQKK